MQGTLRSLLLVYVLVMNEVCISLRHPLSSDGETLKALSTRKWCLLSPDAPNVYNVNMATGCVYSGLKKAVNKGTVQKF